MGVRRERGYAAQVVDTEKRYGVTKRLQLIYPREIPLIKTIQVGKHEGSKVRNQLSSCFTRWIK